MHGAHARTDGREQYCWRQSRILFGTDYPFARNAEKVMKDKIEALAHFDGFDATLRRKIAFDNAGILFSRFAHQGR